MRKAQVLETYGSGWSLAESGQEQAVLPNTLDWNVYVQPAEEEREPFWKEEGPGDSSSVFPGELDQETRGSP